jgi:hypothetical protein
MRDVAKFIRMNNFDTDAVIERQTTRIKENFQKEYKRVAETFRIDAFNELDKIKSVDAPMSKGAFEEFQSHLQGFIIKLAGDRVQKVNKTTKKLVKLMVSKGLEEGLSNRDIAKNIFNNSTAITRRRALVIAKTETHTMAVKSIDESVRASRFKMQREWVAAFDDRTRRRSQGGFEHLSKFPAGANGERVGMDDLFHGTGETLRYPGDPNGSAGNIIHCRCVIIYHTIR